RCSPPVVQYFQFLFDEPSSHYYILFLLMISFLLILFLLFQLLIYLLPFLEPRASQEKYDLLSIQFLLLWIHFEQTSLILQEMNSLSHYFQLALMVIWKVKHPSKD